MKKSLKNLLWWLLIAALLVIIYFILTRVCHPIKAWLIAVILIDYLALLYLNFTWPKEKLGWLYALLIAILPALVVIFVSGWGFWLWALVVVLYLASLIMRSFAVFLDKFWLFAPVLTLFVFLMLWLAHR